jgi:chemotaxis protein CheX
MDKQVGSANAVTPREQWFTVLGDSAKEVFSMMAGVDVSVSDDNTLPVLANVTAVVGIAGAIRAVFKLRCSTLTATKIASAMLGVPAEDAAAQKGDAIGEMCNIIAGDFKAKIGLGEQCMLTVPTVVEGSDFRMRSLADSQKLEMPLLYENEPIWIVLEIAG